MGFFQLSCSFLVNLVAISLPGTDIWGSPGLHEADHAGGGPRWVLQGPLSQLAEGCLLHWPHLLLVRAVLWPPVRHEEPREHREERRLKGTCVAACCSPQEGRLMALLCHQHVGNVRAPRAPPACGESPPGTKQKEKATAVLLETLNCLAGSCLTEHFSSVSSHIRAHLVGRGGTNRPFPSSDCVLERHPIKWVNP